MHARVLLLLLPFVSVGANATLIVVEPDDFAVGTQITSDLLEIVSYEGYIPQPVYAVDGSKYGSPAPTGSNVFGTPVAAFMGDRDDLPWSGLTFNFSLPISSVTIWALNYGYPHRLGIDCFARGVGASHYSVCGGAFDYFPAQGEIFQYTLDLSGQAFDSLTIGGGDAIAAIVFDRLEATAVPEPSGLVLLSIGLLGIGLSSVRRRTSP